MFFHNYYGRHEDWVRYLSEKINTPFILFYHIVEDSLYNIEADDFGLIDRLQQAVSGPWLKRIVLRRSPNRGKDIGGKLVLLDAFLHLHTNSEYILFLHDKKSPHKTQNEAWQKKLFRIADPDFIEQALAHFRKHKKTGLIAGSENIKDEYDHSRKSFISNNKAQLQRLQSEFAIAPHDYHYVAGSMFWVRTGPLLDFFRRFPPLEIRKTLETGNIMDESGGTTTHAWERLLSWLIIAQGYTLKGLS